MRISIVMPALNEAAVIDSALEAAAASDPWEIVVADGCSTDGTVAAARRWGARVVRSRAGRGRQMNRGAAAATGDVLLFVHADTRLPRRFDASVRATLGADGVCAGAFLLRIDAPHRGLRAIEKAVSWRSRRLGLPYGDQAIFLGAETFRRVGGFPEAAVMEDFALVRRLRRLGRIAIADAAVETSARRWLTQGIWRTTALNQICTAAYLLGVSTDRIAAWRYPVGHGSALPEMRLRPLGAPRDVD